jgi:hypothetical protein
MGGDFSVLGTTPRSTEFDQPTNENTVRAPQLNSVECSLGLQLPLPEEC